MTNAPETATCPIVHFDHNARTTETELRALYHGLLDEPTPVWSDAYGGFWVVSAYDQVRDAASDYRRFSSAQGVFFPDMPGRPLGIALEMDPPEHGKYRKLYAEWVNSGKVREYEPTVRSLTDRYVSDFVANGGGDFVRDVAAKLPIQIIAQTLGIDPERGLAFFEVSDRMARNDPQAMMQMEAMCAEEVADRRTTPREDFLSYALRTKIGDAPISDAVASAWLRAGIFAGHDTTLLSGAALIKDLALDPRLQDAIRQDPARASAAVDESLRLNSPVTRFFRVVAEDLEFGGVHMSAGDKVLLVYGAANLDSRRFPEPETFDLDRSYTRHLTYGWGVHRCVGAPLAHLELMVLAQTMVRLCRFSLAVEPEIGAPTALGNFVGFDTLLIDAKALAAV